MEWECSKKTFNILLNLIFWGAFSHLTFQAFDKFLSQPVSTSIFSTIGDDGKFISYPKITICNQDFVQDSKYLNQCSNGSKMYGGALKFCLESEFDFVQFEKSIRFSRETHFQDLQIEIFQRGPVKLNQNQQNLIWSQIISWRFGLCQRLSVGNLDYFKQMKIPHLDSLPYLILKFGKEIRWENAIIFLHEGRDFQDAFELQPWVQFNPQ